MAAQFLPMFAASRLAGSLVVRHRPVRVLTVTQSAMAAGTLAIGVPLVAGWMTLWYLFVLSFVLGGVAATDSTAGQMFVLDLVGERELRRGSSLYGTITGLAKIGGPALAGLIIAANGSGLVFVIDGLSFLVVVGGSGHSRQPGGTRHRCGRRWHPGRTRLSVGA